MTKWFAQKAATCLWNLSFVKEHKGAIAEASGVKALVDLISKWSYDYHVLHCAAEALANLVGDDKCNMEIAQAGGVHAIVMLAHNCEIGGV
ncbi:Amine oxidase [Psidium guajava]|nr:Amine oxidase [Psidium guajava]